MKNLSLYNIPIAYMIVYVILILFTGLWLFLLSQGLNSSDGAIDTLVSIINSPEPKSIHGFIEVATPHMFAIGTMVFVVSHFMLFSTKISQKISLVVFILLFVFAVLNILSYGVITFGWMISGWLKLFSMFTFVLLFLLMLFMVAVSL